MSSSERTLRPADLKQVVDTAGQMLRNIQLALNKGPVDDQLRGLVREAGSLPDLDLLAHRLEVALHTVHSDREDVYEAQVFGVAWQARV